MVAEPAESLSELLGVGGDGTALAGGHGLDRMEREAAHVAVGAVADGAVGGLGPECVRRVLDDDRRSRTDGTQVEREAGVVHGHEGVEPVGQLAEVEVQRVRVDVGEGHVGADVTAGVRRGHERQRRGGHAVGGSEAGGDGRCVQRCRSVGERHSVGRAGRGAQPVFEGLDLGTLGQPGCRHDPDDRFDVRAVDRLAPVGDHPSSALRSATSSHSVFVSLA